MRCVYHHNTENRDFPPIKLGLSSENAIDVVEIKDTEILYKPHLFSIYSNIRSFTDIFLL